MSVIDKLMRIVSMNHSYIPEESEQEAEAQVEQGDAEEEEDNGDSEQ